MSYRGMTEPELQAFVGEFRAYQIWREYVGYATELYGPAAERIEVIAIPERHTGLSALTIDAVHVYDAQRHPLEPDLATEWWQAALREQFPDDELYDDMVHDDWVSTLVDERRATLTVPDSGFEVFLVSRPPRRNYATLYIREEQPRYGRSLRVAG